MTIQFLLLSGIRRSLDALLSLQLAMEIQYATWNYIFIFKYLFEDLMLFKHQNTHLINMLAVLKYL